MESANKIIYLSFLLAFVAGFCDTVTFVAANELFSAHVTGNFIVFAYDLTHDSGSESWVKLLTFPVFFISVMAGGWLAQNTTKKYVLLLMEGSLLCLTGFTVILFISMGVMDSPWLIYFIALSVVVAMGLQNAFGKIFSKETYGPTTMMTGNVTQAALEVCELLSKRLTSPQNISNLKQQTTTIGGFLIGCILGALAGKHVGLSVVILPGILLLFFYLRNSQTVR